MSKCRFIVTVDNGIMHLAAASGKPTVGLFRYGIHRLWLPPVGAVKAITPEPELAVAEIPLQAIKDAIRDVL
jgi:ADP-heptose:LPS heptosyltransferase